MYMSTRKRTQALQVGKAKITVVEVKGARVILSVEAPRDIRIVRKELRPDGCG